MKDLIIRLETEKDYRAVEELTREAFWNVCKPGADEHYYVHQMRKHPDFLPELAFVLEKDREIIGGIYDDRCLVKPLKSAVSLMPNAAYESPYEGAREMLLVENVDNKEFLAELFAAMYAELPAPKK